MVKVVNIQDLPFFTGDGDLDGEPFFGDYETVALTLLSLARTPISASLFSSSSINRA